MTKEFLQRSELLLGKKNLEKLTSSKIIIFGLGGVGGGAIEALARTGIENISLVDYDTIDVTNLNRQIISNINNIGSYKVDQWEQRILSINPSCKVKKFKEKVSSANIESFCLNDYDYIIDAIDDIDGKLALISYANNKDIPIISAMGAGKRLDPTKVRICDIYQTSICPLARKMRKKLKEINIKKLKVVYSEEKPIEGNFDQMPSISFVPISCGLAIASQVVQDLIILDKVK